MPDEVADIRLATLDEADAVGRCMAAFRDFLGDDEPPDTQLMRGARMLLEQGLAEFVVVGTPAHSYVQLRFIPSGWHVGEVCWVEDVFVAEQARGRGLGRALMLRSIDRARERGCARLQLDANERNERAVALYRSLGFESANEWWNGGHDLFFRLSLDHH